LPPGLRAMAAETGSRRMRRSLRSMADRLEAGEDLPAVLQTLQPRLTPLMGTLVEQGAQLGRLDTILHWAAEQARRGQSLRWQLMSTLSYPLFLVDAALVITAFVLFGIVPMFSKIFQDFGTELPPLTKLIIFVSELGTGFAYYAYLFWPILMMIMLFIMLLPIVLLGNRVMSQRWSIAIPVLGPLFRLATLADFCHLLAVFVEMRLPLARAIRLTGQATTDAWLRKACVELADEIDEGQSSQSSAVAAGLPVAIAQMLRDSSSPTTLVEALHGLGDIYAARAATNSRFIGVIAEPFILIFTSLGLGTIVVALFMPLIKLLNDLS
jgi:type II secretory pathway component PulF